MTIFLTKIRNCFLQNWLIYGNPKLIFSIYPSMFNLVLLNTKETWIKKKVSQNYPIYLINKKCNSSYGIINRIHFIVLDLQIKLQRIMWLNLFMGWGESTNISEMIKVIEDAIFYLKCVFPELCQAVGKWVFILLIYKNNRLWRYNILLKR